MALGSLAVISVGAAVAAVLGVGAGLADRPNYPVRLGPRYEFRAEASAGRGATAPTNPLTPAPPAAAVRG
jgi:hypothetical protein